MDQQSENRLPKSIVLTEDIGGEATQEDGKQNAQNPGCPDQQSL
jgi:hypothetical protein